MSIPEAFGYIKGAVQKRFKDVFALFIIVFVAVGSFSLGRLSISTKESILVDRQGTAGRESRVLGAMALVQNGTAEGTEESVVASKTGTKYHFPWCAGARSIKEENKILFSSPEEARSQGYTPAGNCKGLR